MVSSFMQLLKNKYEEKLDEQANEYINYAVDGSNRMKSLIIDLLDFLNVNSNKEEYVQTDMNGVIQNAFLEFADEIKDSRTEITINKLPTVKANKSLIEQLVHNLIANAFKYRNPDKPIIQIDSLEKEDQFLFSVKDNGLGIEQAFFEKIFIVFRRLHNDEVKYRGTGIGLALCKKIVELQGGTIWVESEIGKGSTFYFTLPCNYKK